MKAVILCGGRGSRIRDVSDLIPKPMLPIGGMPILWHIMKGYASHGVKDFILCLGYKGWLIKEFFLNYRAMTTDFTIDLRDKSTVEFHDEVLEEDWKITLADTGEDTYTGGRIVAVKRYLKGEDHFCVTYGDGVGNIDVGTLIDKHIASGLPATVTGVNVSGRFGEMNIADDMVLRFEEKPAMAAGKTNGGYMVFDNSRVWDYFENRPDIWLEREPLVRLAETGHLGLFAHEGFWQCMDTPREYDMLNEMWQAGNAPWRTW